MYSTGLTLQRGVNLVLFALRCLAVYLLGKLHDTYGINFKTTLGSALLGAIFFL